MPVDVSVVIPSFRRPKELAEAIASVLAQYGASVEIFVVDDCPDGSAAEVVAGFADRRLRYIRNPEPSGGRPAAVRNLAWPLATGRFVHFLDDDDRVPAGHYAAVTAAFAAAPGAGVVFGQVAPFGSDAAEVAREQAYFTRAARRAAVCRRFGGKWAFTARQFFGETMLVCGAAVIRRDCVAALAGFDPHLPLMEDVDFYARAIRRFGVHFIDRVSLHYRIGPSLMHGGDVQDLVTRSYRQMHAKYRAEWGLGDFLSLKIFFLSLKNVFLLLRAVRSPVSRLRAA